MADVIDNFFRGISREIKNARSKQALNMNLRKARNFTNRVSSDSLVSLMDKKKTKKKFLRVKKLIKRRSKKLK